MKGYNAYNVWNIKVSENLETKQSLCPNNNSTWSTLGNRQTENKMKGRWQTSSTKKNETPSRSLVPNSQRTRRPYDYRQRNPYVSVRPFFHICSVYWVLRKRTGKPAKPGGKCRKRDEVRDGKRKRVFPARIRGIPF